MRLLLANSRHFRGGGDTTYTFNLAALLREKGHAVAFFAMQDARNAPDPNADLFVSHVDFRSLNRRKSPLGGLRVLGRAIYSLEARRKFGLMLDRFRPHIVHLQNIHAHITPSVVFEANRRGLPVVWTLHDYKLVCPNTHFLVDATGQICEACGRGHFYRAALHRCKKGSLLASAVAALEAYSHRLMHLPRRVDLFLTPSAFLRDKLVQYGLPPDKVRHLPLFLPDGMFQCTGADEGYLLFLGKLEPIKGVRPLLAACRRVPAVQLVLAGRAEEPLAAELPVLLPPNARYVGLQQGAALRRLLHGARGIVLPSLWYENQPFSILEAFAAAKPVIASRLGGVTELVEHGERGLLVPPGDVAALAAAMAWLAGHPEVARRMGERAYAYARQTHSAERHFAALMEAYTAAGGLAA